MAFETARRAISSGEPADVRCAPRVGRFGRRRGTVAPNPWALNSSRGTASTARSRKASVPRPNTRRTTGVTSTSPVSRLDRRASARRRERERGCWLSRRKSPRGKRPRRRATREGLDARVADGGAECVGMGACERARSGTRKRLLSECDEVERRRIRDTSSRGKRRAGSAVKHDAVRHPSSGDEDG